MKTNLAIYLGFVILYTLSCDKNHETIENSFLDFQTIKKDVYLFDKNKDVYRFNVSFFGDIAYCNRSIVGRYLKPDSQAKRYETFITDAQAFYEFSKLGKLWFVPNSDGLPRKIFIKLDESKVTPRAYYSAGTFACFCEAIGQDPLYGDQCVLDEEVDICYSPPGPDVCSDCDIEWCPDPLPLQGIPETRGGGIFLFADTVICVNYNSDVVFGGRTKISLRLSSDTLYFHREYISTYNLFDEYYYNASGLPLDSALNSTSSIIPFDLTVAAQLASDFRCLSSTPPCSSNCAEESQPNGCYRCKCSGTGTGDCDYVNQSTHQIAPFGILVSAAHVVEEY